MSSANFLDATGTQPIPAAPAISLAYLTSTYPTLSMSFFLREVIELRAMGIRIDVASVNMPDRPAEQLTVEEAIEAKNAYHLKKHGLKGAIIANGKTLLTNFGGYCRGVRMVFRLGGLDLKGLFYHLMYFIEALMVGVWMKQKRLHHVHVHLGSQAATVGLYVRTIFGVGFSITVHGPDEFYDAKGQHLTEKIAAADFICCISFFCRSQLMKFSALCRLAQAHRIAVGRKHCGVLAEAPPACARALFHPLRRPLSPSQGAASVDRRGRTSCEAGTAGAAPPGGRRARRCIASPTGLAIRGPRDGSVRRPSEPRSHPCPV